MCFRQTAAYKEKWQKLPVVITVSYCAHLLDKEINRNCGSKQFIGFYMHGGLCFKLNLLQAASSTRKHCKNNSVFKVRKKYRQHFDVDVRKA